MSLQIQIAQSFNCSLENRITEKSAEQAEYSTLVFGLSIVLKHI